MKNILLEWEIKDKEKLLRIKEKQNKSWELIVTQLDRTDLKDHSKMSKIEEKKKQLTQNNIIIRRV